MKKKTSEKAAKKSYVKPVFSAVTPQPLKGAPTTMAIAVVAFVINLTLLPGLGTIIGGKLNHGLVQLLLLWIGGTSLAISGLFLITKASPILGLAIAMLGILMAFAGWVWSIISGIFLIRKAA